MRKVIIFFVRLVLSIVFAFLVCKLYFEGLPHYKILGMALILLGLAYLFEYARKRNRGDMNGS